MRSFHVTLVLLALGFSQAALATPDSELGRHHEDAAALSSAAAASKRYQAFVADLSETNVAIVGVKGMVCDFCARGIEKSFKRDPSVIDLDVDLNKGKIFIAFSRGTQVDFENIKEKVLANGQNAIELKIIDIR